MAVASADTGLLEYHVYITPQANLERLYDELARRMTMPQNPSTKFN